MNQKAFEQEILHGLREQLRRYPAMWQEDTVKYVFQAMLGVGHLLSSREAVTDYIAREMRPLSGSAAEPLCERVGPAWVRLNLRGAKERGLAPSVIAGLMLTPGEALPFTRRDVFDFCQRLAASGEARVTEPEALARILDENWLPSHSAAYRERYQPAYRVIPAEWLPRIDALQRIAQASADRTLVTLDGPCASGKSTLAGKLAEVFGAAVVHTDDYVVPHAQKTAERLAVPGGNCDDARLVSEVLAPWKRGEPVLYRRYACREDLLLPEEKLPEGRMLILEGSYCNVPSIRAYADVRLFLDVPWEVRLERLRRRESPYYLQMFFDRWIPLENRYFEAFGLPDPDCVLLK